MTSASDDPQVIAAAQDRILNALARAETAAYGACANCSLPIMHVFSVLGGWVWLGVYGQDGIPGAQCPGAISPYPDIGYGAHRPKAE